MANPEHVVLVRKGADAIAAWEAENMEALDLSGADLSGADLSGADLAEADLSGANLSTANLMWAILGRADLSGADLSEARLGGTYLNTVDLSQVSGLATVKHQSPSGIGIDTLMTSVRGAVNNLPEVIAFFRRAGVPRALMDALPAIVAEVKYFSCFVCYGQPDLEFATKLDRDLRARGVSCWTYEMDKTLGERTWREIGSRRREADKMVALCSAAALVRPGVRKEIEEQIDEDADKLVPISLDDLWTQAGFPVVRDGRDLKPSLMERNRADFSGWKADQQGYEQALELLLKGLRRPETEQARRKRMRRSRDGGLADLI